MTGVACGSTPRTPAGGHKEPPLHTFVAGTGGTRFVSYSRCPTRTSGLRPCIGVQRDAGTTVFAGGWHVYVDVEGWGVAAPVPWVPAYTGTTVFAGGWHATLMWRVEGVATPVPWVPAYAGTTVFAGGWHVYVGRVEGVAAPVPWVPAYTGTTVFAGGWHVYVDVEG